MNTIQLKQNKKLHHAVSKENEDEMKTIDDCTAIPEISFSA